MALIDRSVDFDSNNPSALPWSAALMRLASDGMLLWEVSIPTETLTSEPRDEVTAVVGDMDMYDDGTILVSVMVAGFDRVEDDSGVNVVGDALGVLLWYGLDGELLATRDFPLTQNGQGITYIESVLALPGGGSMFSGSRWNGWRDGLEVTTGSVVVRLDADREVAWSVPVDRITAAAR